MTFAGLLLRNLFYHRRGNVAVFLGVVLGTAVLTGALLVGDSLRGSLRQRALEQLGWVNQAMVTPRFFRASLAQEISPQSSPLAMLQGSARSESVQHILRHGQPARAGKVIILGVDETFWKEGEIPLGAEFWRSGSATAVLNAALARQLGVKVGDEVSFSVAKPERLPRESLLGHRASDQVLQTISVKVGAILPDHGIGRFSLRPSPEPVRNLFVPLRFLEQKLAFSGQVNAIVTSSVEELRDRLAEKLTLEDWGLKLRSPADRARAFVKYVDPRNVDQGRLKKVRWNGRVPESLAKMGDDNGGILTLDQIVAYYQKHRNYLSLESRQLYLDETVVDAVDKVAERLKTLGRKVRFMPTLVYLADSISDGNTTMPYAVVAGVEPDMLRFDNDPQGGSLENNEIALAAWPQAPVAPQRNDPFTLHYFMPDERNDLKLEKRQASFSFRGRVPLEGPFDDPDFTPEFPGMTDKLDMSGWENPPFPYKPARVKPSDEDYWKRYRTTPKAYVTLETAQKLWGSRFGKLTSVHIYPGDDASLAEFRTLLLGELKPQQGGFVFQPVKDLALKAGAGSTDFSVLFLAFSFFLIAAALLLVGLLFRLNLDRRAAEIGVLLSTGWTKGRVRRLLLVEGAVLAILGGILGLAGAFLYADQMLALLRRNWPGGENLAFLEVHAEPVSFVIGFVASVTISFLTIIWATRVLAQMTPRALLAGENTGTAQPISRSRTWSRWLMVAAALGAVGSLTAGMLVTGHEAQAGSFFGSGALLLIACLAGLWAWFRRAQTATRTSAPEPTVGGLGVRNVARHPVRSLLTVGLLGSASFLIVAVESFHKETGADFFDKEGGSGGFPLLAETDVAFFQDLNDPGVRKDLKISGLSGVVFFPARVEAGDDASCLNLYQPLRPKLLGIGHRLIERGGFRFSATLAETAAEKDNPWLLLERPTGDGSIPAIVDANSASWILKTPLGGAYEIMNARGEKKLKIVALLHESIFQSEIVLAEKEFLELFPRQEGFRFFLIQCPPRHIEAIQSTLEDSLGDLGFNVASTAARLEAYLAVENTYLATFQALGGLGLILRALGLAIVLLRGVWERRGELALLRALGFAKPRLAWLEVLAENLFLLLAGLVTGTLAALLAVAPHLIGAEAQVLWLRICGLLALVLLVGLAAGMAAVIGTLRAPLLPALRRE